MRRPRRAHPLTAPLLALAAPLLALAAFFLALAAAAPARADSVFAVGGLGEPSLPEGARIRALGGAGVAEHGANSYSFVNPASIALAQHLALQATLLSTIRSTKSLNYGDQDAYDSAFPSIRLVIRLPGSFVLGASYVLGTNADFVVVRSESAGVVSQLGIEGGGGIQLARASLARRLGRGFNAGVDFEIVGGGYNELWVRQFVNPNYFTARDTLQVSWDRLGRWRLGLNYVAPAGWALGGVYETARSLPLTFKQTTQGAATYETGRSLDIPSGYTLGFAAPIGGRNRVVGQYQRINWERSSLQSDLVDFHPQERYSIGFERGVPRIPGPSALDRLPIRLGYTYLRWPDLLPVAGASDISGGTAAVTEWAVSIGTGANSPDKGGAFDVSIEGGKRGNFDSLGASESFLRIAISLQVTDESWK
jgi:hypothetical protein